MPHAPEMLDRCRPGGDCPDCNGHDPEPLCCNPFCNEPADGDDGLCLFCRETGDEYASDEPTAEYLERTEP